MICITDDVFVAASEVKAAEYISDRTRDRVRITMKPDGDRPGEVYWPTVDDPTPSRMRALLNRIVNDIDVQISMGVNP